MLDVYYTGSVDRISPEAPVPVVRTKSVQRVPGGAANVCKNLATLGGQATLLGFVGHDENSDQLMALLVQEGVRNACVATNAPCVTKIRVVGGHQQIVRVDFDSNPGDFTDADYASLKARVREQVPSHDLIILSDYAKGVCRDDVCRAVIEAAGSIPVLVDPKHNRWTKYAGAALVKPNLKELGEAAGRAVANEDADIESAAAEVLRAYDVGAILVTRSDQGMSYVGAEKFHEPSAKQEVFDVSGAGDTVLAALALSLAAGNDRRTSVHLANLAGGVVVGKLGTASVTPRELAQRLAAGPPPSKVVDPQRLSEIRADLAAHGAPVVFTNGVFDILHTGHIDYLRKARALGAVLVVGLNSDASTRRLKGPTRPINRQEDRAALLAALEFVDYVTIFDEDTPLDLIRALRPDILVKGGDYRLESIVGREFAGRTTVIPFVDGYSTTGLVERLQQPKPAQ
jgi:D-beta-D-heptose 7-phosphate kinase/D-beta-D-heptose 1-phosphate adenosyltransferase